MTEQRICASDTAVPKSHRHYEFGTFDERLAHSCNLLEVAPPNIVYEDGEVLVTVELSEWISACHVSTEWLFWGNPAAMLSEWTKRKGLEHQFHDITRQLEPEVQECLLVMLRAVVNHNLPIAESMAIFDKVVKEYRSNEAA